ncbi:MAG: AgmX/PglI C-terminal domain-containing protein, partial [Deltaproteobacteria bacterium]|nr:AgmX/PglI C-terminal domain-containing protein [Deltaproteobacteria bacterium]
AAPYSARALEVDARNQVIKDEESKSRLVRLSVELGDISTSKGLSKNDIQKVVKQRLSSFELCYQKFLEKKPNIQGGITLQLAIDSSGRVTKVILVSSKLNDNNLEQCIIQKIKELTFPTPEGIDKVTATVSFNLKCS